jgi:hypothetical protein
MILRLSNNMFRLNNVDLPVSPEPLSNMGSVCRFWYSETDRGMGPLLRVSAYANWWTNPGWTVDDLNPEKPDFIGDYSTVSVNAELADVRIVGYKKVSSADEALPDSFWFSTDKIHFYQKTVPTEAAITFTSSILSTAPYTISIPDNFTPAAISPGESFTQSGASLTIESTELLVIGDLITVIGTLAINPVVQCAIASFILPVEFLDQVDWIGKSFRSCKDIINPVLWEFTWNQPSKVANTFIDRNYLPNFQENNQITGIQGIGSLTYDR